MTFLDAYGVRLIGTFVLRLIHYRKSMLDWLVFLWEVDKRSVRGVDGVLPQLSFGNQVDIMHLDHPYMQFQLTKQLLCYNKRTISYQNIDGKMMKNIVIKMICTSATKSHGGKNVEASFCG